MATETKYCVDCAYCVPSEHEGLNSWKFSGCSRAVVKDGYTMTHPDLDKEGLSLPYCRVERELKGDKHCNPEARFFKARIKG